MGPWGDAETLRKAMAQMVAQGSARHTIAIAVGIDSTLALPPGFEVRRFPYTSSPAAMARYYQAADCYVHCARIDTFPTAILEALACGTPVVASAVGGIPEQIRPIDPASIRSQSSAIETATGVLVPSGDAPALADAIVTLLADGPGPHRIGRNAADDARVRFDVGQQIDGYLSWYRTIIEHWNGHAHAGGDRTAADSNRQSTMALRH
jgi:glycosyltransferase involved in cell wall biosynthesis